MTTDLSRRALLRAGLLSGAALGASPVLLSRPARAGAPPVGGVHLGAGTDAARVAAVSWSTAASVAGAVLDVGTDHGYGLRVRPDTRAVAGHGTVYHHGLVRGLEPGTRYHYRVSHSGGRAVTGTFRTAPLAGQAFRFAAFGDMGVSAEARLVLAALDRARPDLALVVGDLCYANPGGGLSETAVDQTVWDQWFEQIRSSAAGVPWVPAIGNHEIEAGFGELGYDGYLARFALPGSGARGGRVTWSMRYGNVGFVALDGNDASHEIPRNRGYLGAVQDRWLDATLQALRADPEIDFIVVGFHHCAFSTNAVHGSDAGVRDRWSPLFDRYAVDLVVNGHNHSYERTHPVRGGQPTVQAPTGATVSARRDGTTYVLAGGGGQAAYPTALHPASVLTVEGGLRVPETALWSSVRYLDHSMVLVDVTPAATGVPARMRLSAVDTAGQVVDRVTLEAG